MQHESSTLRYGYIGNEKTIKHKNMKTQKPQKQENTKIVSAKDATLETIIYSQTERIQRVAPLLFTYHRKMADSSSSDEEIILLAVIQHIRKRKKKTDDAGLKTG